MRNWYANNKEKYAKWSKDWSSNHKAKRVQITQAYVMRHKEEVAAYNKLFDRTLAGVFRTYKYTAKRKGRVFDLSLSEFRHLLSQPCAYCGETQDRRGIDRKNNTEGYTLDNSVPACRLCNYMKRDYATSHFLSHVQKITDFNRNGNA